MQSNSAPVKGASTNKCWHPFREQLKDIDTIIQRRYNDSVPESPVGMALVDQAISRIRCLAKLDKVDDCGLREAEVFCGNYAPWMDAGEYSFKGYDPTTALKSKELGQAIELTAQEKYKWGIKYIKSVDVVPDIEAAKAERKKYQAAARKERHRRKMQAEKAKIERQAMLQVHELAAQGFDNEQIAKAMNALGMRTPAGRGLWREKMVTELLGRDTSAEKKAEAKRKADLERQHQARLRRLEQQELQRLKAHADMLAEVISRIQELRQQGESYRSVACTLNAEGAPTLTGQGEWNDNAVRRLLARQNATACDKSVTPRAER
jgi:division protein CdvB (Snf7/Vps24/ESCRT-III family)